jgi:hypothetical protein
VYQHIHWDKTLIKGDISTQLDADQRAENGIFSFRGGKVDISNTPSCDIDERIKRRESPDGPKNCSLVELCMWLDDVDCGFGCGLARFSWLIGLGCD